MRFRRAVLLRSEKDQDSETQQRDDSRAELGEKPAPNGASCVTVPGETWGGGARGARASPRAPLAVTGAESRGRCEHRRAPRSAPGRVRPPPCAWTSPRATRVGARGPVTEVGRTRRALVFPGVFAGPGLLVSLLSGRVLPLKLSVPDIFHVGRFLTVDTIYFIVIGLLRVYVCLDRLLNFSRNLPISLKFLMYCHKIEKKNELFSFKFLLVCSFSFLFVLKIILFVVSSSVFPMFYLSGVGLFLLDQLSFETTKY